MNGTVVIGVGNEFRGDDGVGRVVVRRLAEQNPDGVAVHESTGEALSLMELWGDASRVILVDAAEADGAPGAVHRLDASVQALPSAYFHTSTHAFSVADAVEMARSLGRLPPKVIVYGVQGASFAHGAGLTPEAQRGADEALRLILAEISAGNP
jgi:hydrogenase maturation protease